MLAAGDHQLARGEEHLQRTLLGLPSPPTAFLPVGTREVSRAHGTVLPDMSEYPIDDGAVFVHPFMRVLPAERARVGHAVPEEGIVFDRHEGSLVGPVLKERAFREQLVKPDRIVIPEPAPEHEVRAARHHVNRVDLKHPHPADGGQYIGFARESRRPLDTLRRKKERPGGAQHTARLAWYWTNQGQASASRRSNLTDVPSGQRNAPNPARSLTAKVRAEA